MKRRVYLMEFIGLDTDERFYKVGVTFKYPAESRFPQDDPVRRHYSIKEIRSKSLAPDAAESLETHLIVERDARGYSYMPLVTFDGDGECLVHRQEALDFVMDYLNKSAYDLEGEFGRPAW